MHCVAITGIGHYVPPATLSNSDLQARLETTDEWIREHTGILTRHVASSGGVSELAVAAIQRCLALAGRTIDETDCLVVATSTPDYAFPSTGSITLRKLGAKRPWAFDVSAACSGFLYGLSVAKALIQSASCTRVVVCGADRMTAITDYSNRLTAVLFGDAAGAMLLEASDDPTVGLIDVECRVQPAAEGMLYQPAGGSVEPATLESVVARRHFLSLMGREVFESAVDGMTAISESIMARNALRAERVDWFVPHQANVRIINEVAKRVGIATDRVMVNLDRYGNTSAASIPLCLSEWHEARRIEYGADVVLASFGAGFTTAGAYARWGLPPVM